jgi:hypothetical protein
VKITAAGSSRSVTLVASFHLTHIIPIGRFVDTINSTTLLHIPCHVPRRPPSSAQRLAKPPALALSTMQELTLSYNSLSLRTVHLRKPSRRQTTTTAISNTSTMIHSKTSSVAWISAPSLEQASLLGSSQSKAPENISRNDETPISWPNDP